MKMFSLVLLMSSIYGLAQDASGFWQGAIQIQGQSLEIFVDLNQAEDGWQGTIDIPMQGLKGLALSEISAKGEKVHFKMEAIPGGPYFDGTLVDSGKRIEGDFNQNGQAFKFELQRGDKAAYLAKTKKKEITPVKGSGAPGTWTGDLKAGPTELRLIFEVVKEGDQLNAVLNSVDQGVKLKADRVDFSDGSITIEIAQIQGSFKGAMNEDGSAFEGTWAQGQMQVPLTVYRIK